MNFRAADFFFGLVSNRFLSKLLWTAAILGPAEPAFAVIIETVPVGNPGNPGDTSGGVSSFGSVGYTFNMGKFEITTGQYAEFLNAVAVTDTYGVYNPLMNAADINGSNIKRTGSIGSYTYTVGDGSPTDVANWANRPVNGISWGDAARFANWMHNGQPIGPQGLSTTEDGSYFLNGSFSQGALLAVTRKPNATWVIPSENEWYKAAYHKNDGVTGNYWEYPFGSNLYPNNGNPEGDTGNTANFFDGDYAIGGPYWRTNVGYFGLSGSPYGTFDQGGNVWEWTEAVIGTGRGTRGGYFGWLDEMWSGTRVGLVPNAGGGGYGFRLAEIPEPGSIVMFALASAWIIRRRWT